MTGTVIQSHYTLNGLGLQQKTRNEPESVGNATDDFSPSESTASTSSLHVSDPDEVGDLPPTFRSAKAEPNVRQKSAIRIRPSTNLQSQKTAEERIEKDTAARTTKASKPIKKTKSETEPLAIKKRLSEGSQREETKFSEKGEKIEEIFPKHEMKVPRRRSAKMKTQERRESRNCVLESLGKFELTQAEGERIIPQRDDSATLKRDPYAPKSLDVTDELSDGSISLDELPPSGRDEKCGRSVAKSSCSQKSSSSFNASLDLSGHLALPIYEQVKTSASYDQWARFKLLGRLGLGEIRLSEQAEGLVERSYGIMLKAIKHIYALRDGNSDEDSSVESLDYRNSFFVRSGHLLEEVRATIHVPLEGPAKLKREPNTIEVDPVVQRQLRDFIAVVCKLYRDNPFHDFEHASNVLRAVDKIIGLVSQPGEELDYRNLKHGYGVAREPWNHFALVFAALVHDVDHLGVSNAQLVKEGAQVAWAYKNKSVAEQNSIELAWNLLMEPCYLELRMSIFQKRSEFINFRSLVVTAVMATDIADKELAALRTGRAADALKAQEDEERATRADMDLVRCKATFVLETIIQVADVSHTMSSFDVFKKWNHKLYREMYQAYKNGRADQDPAEYWYEGEFGFFDFYVIPLAKKLGECGIYGDVSAEYLNNAIQNKKLWQAKGQSLVSRYVAETKKEESSGNARVRESKSKVVSLRGMVLSVHSKAVSEFAGDDDDDSVSISSDDSDDRKNTRYHTKRASMRQHFTTVLAGSGKVPSKASIEIQNDRKLFLQSHCDKAEELERVVSAHEREDGLAMKIRLRSRSQSPNAPSPARSSSNLRHKLGCSVDDDSSSEEGEKSLHSRSRSCSPGSVSEHCPLRSGSKTHSQGSGSERSETRSILKKRIESHLPGSGSEKTKLKSTKKKRKPGNKSSTSNSEKTQEQRQPRAGRKGMRERRPSRSRSPASSVESEALEPRPRTDCKRGKRPSMVKASSIV